MRYQGFPPRSIGRSHAFGLTVALSVVPWLAMRPVQGAPVAAKAAETLSKAMTLTAGLARVRAHYRPAVVIFDGDIGLTESSGLVDRWLPSEAFAAYSLSRSLKPYVLIRVSPAELARAYPLPALPEETAGGLPGQPPGGPVAVSAPKLTVGDVLGLREGTPAAIILDLRERIVRFYDRPPSAAKRGESAREKSRRLPRTSLLKRHLRQIAKVNFVFAKEARRVEPLLEKAQYSYAAGDSRAAVILVRPLEPPKAQTRMDPVLKDKLAVFLVEIREAAERALARAEALERQRQHFKAIDAFDKTAFDFPFRDVAIRASRRSGAILRKLSFGK